MNPSPEPLIQCVGLTCGYPGRVVLEGVGFELAAGSVTVLLGPNGSGKSTLLKTMSKTLAPLAGSVFVGDASIQTLEFRDLARRVAYVPQEEHAAFPFTMREIVLMGRLPHSEGLFETDEDHEAAEAAMRAADCLELADRPVTELSGGERQRGLIARALAQRAPALLLDEPTSHLDVGHQVEIVRLLRRLAEEGYGVLAAVHDLNLAAALADRALLLADGGLGMDGACEEVLASPQVDAVYGVQFRREGKWMAPNY